MNRPLGRISRLGTLLRALGLARQAAQRERWPRERLLAYQHARLGSLVAHATRRCAFYRSRYGGEIPADRVALRDLPVVTKQEWMGAFDTVVADPRLKLAAVEAHLQEARADVLYLDEYRVMASSGSTGRRGIYLWSRADWQQALGIFLRDTDDRQQGPRLPRLRCAVIGAPDARHMSYRFGASVDCGIYRILRLSATRPLAELTDALQQFRPDMVVGFPSILALIAAEQVSGRLAISPRWIDTTGELRTAEMTRWIEQAWSVDLTNSYALSETGLAGWTCAQGRQLHLCEDACILEPVDEHGRPVPPGQPGERLLVTSLLNHTQPVLRLDVSDQLTISTEPCACGRTMAWATELRGRADDVLELPARDGTLASLHPVHLRSPLAATPEVLCYQIVQRGHALDLDVVPAGSDDTLAARLTDRLRGVLRERGIADVPVQVRCVHTIPREPGVGKFKLVRVDAHAAPDVRTRTAGSRPAPRCPS